MLLVSTPRTKYLCLQRRFVAPRRRGLRGLVIEKSRSGELSRDWPRRNEIACKTRGSFTLVLGGNPLFLVGDELE